MKPILMACGEGVSIDRRTNNVTLYNILEEMAASAFPMVIPRMFLLVMLENGPGEADNRDITLKVSLGEVELLSQVTAISYQGKARTRVAAELHGIVVPGPGSLRFEVFVDGRVLVDYAIAVNSLSQAQLQVLGGGSP